VARDLLLLYGIEESAYKNDAEMFDLIHQMRTRIIKSPAFNENKILGAILFEQTMDNKIDGKYTAEYLWEEKHILPFLKVDKGLLDLDADGVQLMKPISNLADLLKRANEHHVFGTKMRSVVKKASKAGIARIVDQQFEIAAQIIAAGLVPIIEPEVDINIPDKAEAEAKLLTAEAEAQAIRKIALAVEGSGANPAQYLIAVRYLETLKEMTSGKDNKTVYLPYEASGVLSSLGGIKELLK